MTDRQLEVLLNRLVDDARANPDAFIDVGPDRLLLGEWERGFMVQMLADDIVKGTLRFEKDDMSDEVLMLPRAWPITYVREFADMLGGDTYQACGIQHGLEHRQHMDSMWYIPEMQDIHTDQEHLHGLFVPVFRLRRYDEYAVAVRKLVAIAREPTLLRRVKLRLRRCLGSGCPHFTVTTRGRTHPREYCSRNCKPVE